MARLSVRPYVDVELTNKANTAGCIQPDTKRVFVHLDKFMKLIYRPRFLLYEQQCIHDGQHRVTRLIGVSHGNTVRLSQIVHATDDRVQLTNRNAYGIELFMIRSDMHCGAQLFQRVFQRHAGFVYQ